MVSGVVGLISKDGFAHNGITLTVEGIVKCVHALLWCCFGPHHAVHSLQLSAKSVGVFEAFYNSIKPVTVRICN